MVWFIAFLRDVGALLTESPDSPPRFLCSNFSPSLLRRPPPPPMETRKASESLETLRPPRRAPPAVPRRLRQGVARRVGPPGRGPSSCASWLVGDSERPRASRPHRSGCCGRPTEVWRRLQYEGGNSEPRPSPACGPKRGRLRRDAALARRERRRAVTGTPQRSRFLRRRRLALLAGAPAPPKPPALSGPGKSRASAQAKPQWPRHSPRATGQAPAPSVSPRKAIRRARSARRCVNVVSVDRASRKKQPSAAGRARVSLCRPGAGPLRTGRV